VSRRDSNQAPPVCESRVLSPRKPCQLNCVTSQVISTRINFVEYLKFIGQQLQRGQFNVVPKFGILKKDVLTPILMTIITVTITVIHPSIGAYRPYRALASSYEVP
jgi:hypothetical protein